MTNPEAAEAARQAAAELHKAREANDMRAGLVESMGAGNATAEEIARERREISDRSMEIAEGLILVAAIEAGLELCYHPVRPEAGQEPGNG